jgi:hypothetical protein
VAAGVEDDDGQGGEVQLAALAERRIDDGARLGEGETGHDNLQKIKWMTLVGAGTGSPKRQAGSIHRAAMLVQARGTLS